jgi:hypothetical protein
MLLMFEDPFERPSSAAFETRDTHFPSVACQPLARRTAERFVKRRCVILLLEFAVHHRIAFPPCYLISWR